jgi:hypothetical protein
VRALGKYEQVSFTCSTRTIRARVCPLLPAGGLDVTPQLLSTHALAQGNSTFTQVVAIGCARQPGRASSAAGSLAGPPVLLAVVMDGRQDSLSDCYSCILLEPLCSQTMVWAA